VQLHQLRYAVTLAEERQFVRAATRLRVAQPSVSAAVRTLERDLGVRLFDRSSGGVRLTAAGEAFLPWARRALDDCEAGISAVRELSGLQRGRITLGATPSLTMTVLPSVLSSFRRDFPAVELSVREAGSRDLVDGLERGAMDFALVILPVTRPWVRTTTLGRENLVLAVAPEHPLAGRSRIEVGELRDVPLVMFRDGYDLRESTLAACRDAGFQPTYAAEGLEMGGGLAMARAGLGAAVVPASVVADSAPCGSAGLLAVPFARGELSRTIGLAFHQERTLPAAAVALVRRLETEVTADWARSGPGDA
jgi:DNA-binding transcriptional LysR family regulator